LIYIAKKRALMIMLSTIKNTAILNTMTRQASNESLYWENWQTKKSYHTTSMIIVPNNSSNEPSQESNRRTNHHSTSAVLWISCSLKMIMLLTVPWSQVRSCNDHRSAMTWSSFRSSNDHPFVTSMIMLSCWQLFSQYKTIA
jgi:hypothetical protein